MKIHEGHTRGYRLALLIEIRRQFGHQQQIIGVEIGVMTGTTSYVLLHNLPNLQLHMIDPWSADVFGPDNQESYAGYPQRTWDLFHKLAQQTASQFPGRAHVHRKTSRDAAQLLHAKPDFAFVDGSHAYRDALQDLEIWAPLVHRLYVHDYGHPDDASKPEFPGVTRAVDEFVSSHGLQLEPLGDSLVAIQIVDAEVDSSASW